MRWLRLLCLSLVVMRCQPLRRALYASNQKVDSSDNLISESA
ncbi:acetyltransferase [Vibrio cholerae]|nr:acetyltransferase [Vibrio cholerae]TYA00859.1 acetyltransferase [Vibrio cholerae]